MTTIPVRGYLFLLPALIGATLVIYATGIYGAGVDGDSVFYYNAGENLLTRGEAVTTLFAGPPESLTHFPPLYPALLAPLHLSGAGIEHSTTLLNAVLFMLYLVAIQLLVLRVTEGAYTVALLAGFYAALSTAALTVYARVWSETLFLVLFLFGVLLLCQYLQTSGMASLLAAAALFALAWFSRYIGVTLVATGALAILLWSDRPIRLRMREFVLFGSVAVAPMAMFLVRNYRTTETITDRSLSYHPVPLAWWLSGVDTLSAWLIPVAAPFWMKAFAALAVLIIAGLGLYVATQDSRREAVADSRTGRLWIIPAALLLFIAIYLGFFVAVVTFADTGQLSGRILSPIYSSMIVVAAYVGYTIFRRYGAVRPALVTGVIVVLCGGLLGIQLLRSAVWATQARAEGFEYSSRAWRTAPAVDFLLSLPDDTPLYSNRPHAIFFLLGRKAHPVAFNHCFDGCALLDADLDAIPEGQRDTAVLVWAQGQGFAECYDCVLIVAPEHNFVSIHQDDYFHLLKQEDP